MILYRVASQFKLLKGKSAKQNLTGSLVVLLQKYSTSWILGALCCNCWIIWDGIIPAILLLLLGAQKNQISTDQSLGASWPHGRKFSSLHRGHWARSLIHNQVKKKHIKTFSQSSRKQTKNERKKNIKKESTKRSGNFSSLHHRRWARRLIHNQIQITN